MPGRKPKASTIIDRQRGQLGPDLVGARLPAPNHLSNVAKAEWKRMARLLRDAGLLTVLDTTALELYCIAYGEHMEAQSTHSKARRPTSGSLSRSGEIYQGLQRLYVLDQ